MRDLFIFTPKVKENLFPIILTSFEDSPEFQRILKEKMPDGFDKKKVEVPFRELHHRLGKLSDNSGKRFNDYNFRNFVSHEELEMILSNV